MMNFDKIRLILNILFMIGALSTMVIYFAFYNEKLMFYVCCVTIFFKFIEYAFRFTQNNLNNRRKRDND